MRLTDFPNLPSTVPPASCRPVGARVLVQALYRVVGGELVEARPGGELKGFQFAEEVDKDHLGIRPEQGKSHRVVDGAMPPAALYLVVGLGDGDIIHGVPIKPEEYVQVGNIVALADGAKPVQNPLTYGTDQGLVTILEILNVALDEDGDPVCVGTHPPRLEATA
jgi:hypothetical protein